MKYILYLTVVALVCGPAVQAQVSSSDTTQIIVRTDTPAVVPARLPVAPPPVRKPRKPPPIAKEFSGGARWNTNGWTLFVEKGWVKSEERLSDYFYDTRIFQVELSEIKHTKEKKAQGDLAAYAGEGDARPFIFGKVNNFYALKLGYGLRKMIAGKPEQGNVSIHWVGVVGLSLGMLKPYYVDAYVQQWPSGQLSQQSITYTDTTKFSFLNRGYIIGSSGFTKGLNEMKFVPGIHAKTGLHFDFAASKTTKLAIETGINMELYTQNIILMANQKATPFLFNVYTSLQFGKRY